MSFESPDKRSTIPPQSPRWADLLDHVGSQISGPRQTRGAGVSSLQGMSSTLARADWSVLIALESGSSAGEDTIAQLAVQAVELVLAVAGVSARSVSRAEDRRCALAGQIAADVASRAHEIEHTMVECSGIVAHHLAAGLRHAISRHAPGPLSASPPDDPAGDPRLGDDSMRLATNEYLAIAAFDAQLDLIYGARSVGRPGSFQHCTAWHYQAAKLTFALQAYVAGIRGDASRPSATHHPHPTRALRRRDCADRPPPVRRAARQRERRTLTVVGHASRGRDA
jgi:hypothetical protein